MTNDFDLPLFVAQVLIPAVLANQAMAVEFSGEYQAKCTDTECVVTMTIPLQQEETNPWANGDEILSQFLTSDNRLQATQCPAGEWTAVYQTQYANGLWSGEVDAGLMVDCRSDPINAPDPLRWRMKSGVYSSDWTSIFPRGPA